MVKKFIFSWLVLSSIILIGAGQINKSWEYWFNYDYEGRLSSSIDVSPGVVFSQHISTTGLEAGMHTLHYRFRDSKGLWSVPQSFSFFKGGKLISGFEYWFNDDFENRTHIEPAGTDVLEFSASVQTSHLGYGMHKLSYRFTDNLGITSPVQSTVFWKTGQRLSAYEYWLDDVDSQKFSGNLSGENELSWIKTFAIEDVNFRKLYIRFKDSGGLWSSLVTLDVPETVPANSYEKLANVSVYPNPAAQKLYITHNTEAGKSVVFNMYDVEGRVILSRDFGTSPGLEVRSEIDIGHLQNGVYLCVVESGNERSVFKTVISR